MKQKLIITVILFAMTALLWAKGTPFALGFGLADSAGNLGINLEVSSPSFAKDFLMVRFESQLDFLSAYRNNPDVEWERFSTHRFGLVGSGGWNSDTIRLYGEFGGLMVLPSSVLSDDMMQWGIYGLFGYEFFFRSEEKLQRVHDTNRAEVLFLSMRGRWIRFVCRCRPGEGSYRTALEEQITVVDLASFAVDKKVA